MKMAVVHCKHGFVVPGGVFVVAYSQLENQPGVFTESEA